jgi:hypothetical protein
VPPTCTPPVTYNEDDTYISLYVVIEPVENIVESNITESLKLN